MLIKDLELCFNRALLLCFNKKKVFVVFPVLVLCGILIVVSRALGFSAIKWLSLSFFFLPLFLSSGILLALGTLLTRIYYHDVKESKMPYRKILLQSYDLIIGTSYLSIPPILIYLLLWIFLGFFILLKELPTIGEFFGVILAFAPFLIILSSIFLIILNLAILFFVTPAIALGAKQKLYLTHKILIDLKKNIFRSTFFFLLGILPLSLMVLCLTLAVHLTGVSYFVSDHVLSITLRSFFIMVPFCFFLTFPIIFFFNFAAETYNFFVKNEEKDER